MCSSILYFLTLNLSYSYFSFVDPAMSHASPCPTDLHSIVPAEDSNIKGIVSDIISSKFPQVTFMCEKQKTIKIGFSFNFMWVFPLFWDSFYWLDASVLFYNYSCSLSHEIWGIRWLRFSY